MKWKFKESLASVLILDPSKLQTTHLLKIL